MIEVSEKVREAYQELPVGWKLQKLKFFANIRNSNVDKMISEDEQPVRLCNYTDVYYNDRITPDMDFIEGSATVEEVQRFWLKRDQVIVTKDSEDWNDIGVPALVTKDMPEVLCGYHLSVFEPGPELDGGFLAWLCRSAPLNDQFKLAANGVTRFGLGQYPMKNAFIARPPLDTQRRIAQFLDEKTARVDTLIGKKRELLERLAEKRQALITRAVTKGLDPDAPITRSGQRGHHQASKGDYQTAEAAGGMTGYRLPVGWSSKRLKYLATYNDEVLSENTDEDQEIDYVEISGVSLSRGIEELERITFGQAPSRARRKLRRGDILISTVRTYLRAITRVDKASPDLIASTGFCVVRPKNNVDSGFLGWVAQSEPFVSEVVACSVGVSYPAINASALVTIEMPTPPLDMQRRIAQFLDEKTSQIDEQCELIVQSLETLAEYRTALITAATTGKIDVQEALQRQ